MKTEVNMKRELFGMVVRQKTKNEFFSATDLVKAGNRWRIINNKAPFNLSTWFAQKGVREFIDELERKYGRVKMKYGRQTWVHPLLFIDIALAINPRLKIEVYEWLFDQLIKHRNNSGDSYKQMCGNLYARHGNKRTFPDFIMSVAAKVKLKCNVRDWNEATEEQLKLRDKIHNEIALLSDVLRDNDEAVRLSLLRH